LPVTIVVGGQYGSEGKGKLVAYLAQKNRIGIAVRCGGPNAGHSVSLAGKLQIVRQIPAAVINPAIRLLVAAGALVDPTVMVKEIKQLGLDDGRLGIDPFAAVISPRHKEKEARLKLDARLSSTLSGTGAATASKTLREPDLKLAGQVPRLKDYMVDVAAEINAGYDRGEKILVEGTQGFGLSLHHSRLYPYVTSRDTSAANFLSEAGLSPFCATEIIMVVRTHPIRVPGKSGPLQEETSWQEITMAAGAPLQLNEFTSVTKRLRRVGFFERLPVTRATMVNRPTALALQGVDYLNYQDRGKRDFDNLSEKSKSFVAGLEKSTGVPVKYVFTGPDLLDVIERDPPANNEREEWYQHGRRIQ
jgi:adenylosuccinate synthase